MTQRALDVLARAVEIGGCAEEPSRRLMVLQSQMGQIDAMASTWRGLQRRLADLDLEPEPKTIGLYRRLLGHGPPLESRSGASSSTLM